MSLPEEMLMSAEEHIKTTVEELLKVLAIKNVIGDPIEVEDKVLIPVTSVGLGFGAGAGAGEGKAKEGEEGKGSGAGGGGGAGASPVAMVAIFKGVPGPEGVKVLPLTAPSPIAKAIGEIASTIVEKSRAKKEIKKEGEEQKQTKPVEE
jgi:uncharacterized spore protein YtfJ